MARDPQKKLVQFQASNGLVENLIKVAAKNHSTVPGAVLFIVESWLGANGYHVGTDLYAEELRLKRDLKGNQPSTGRIDLGVAEKHSKYKGGNK